MPHAPLTATASTAPVFTASVLSGAADPSAPAVSARRRDRPVVTVRPLTPDDSAACRVFADHLEPEDLRLRFASPTRVEDGLRRLLLAIEQNSGTVLAAIDGEAIVGVARLVPIASVEAEIALLVRSDLKGRGIGAGLLEALIDRGLAAGYEALSCDILYENWPMRRLAAAFGFRHRHQDGPMTEMRLSLAPMRRSCFFPW